MKKENAMMKSGGAKLKKGIPEKYEHDMSRADMKLLEDCRDMMLDSEVMQEFGDEEEDGTLWVRVDTFLYHAVMRQIHS